MKKIVLLSSLVGATITASSEMALQNGALNAFMGTITLQKGLQYYTDTKTSWLMAGITATMLSMINEAYQASNLKNPLVAKDKWTGTKLSSSMRAQISRLSFQVVAFWSVIGGLCIQLWTRDLSKTFSKSLGIAAISYWWSNMVLNAVFKVKYYKMMHPENGIIEAVDIK